MALKRWHLLVVALLVTAATAGAGASLVDAQSAGNSSETTVGEETSVASIDRTTKVLDYGYNSGTFWVVVRAERPTLLVLSDLAGAVKSGGGAAKIPTKRISVDGRTRITFDVSKHEGTAAVSVATPASAVALTVDAHEPFIKGHGRYDVHISMLVSLAVGLTLPVIIVYRRKKNDHGEAEREI